jgi:lysophospholipase L1-like esterase
MTNRAKGVVFALILLMATFVLGEVLLRVAQYARAGTSLTTLLPKYRDDRRFVQSPFLVFGPRINWQIPGRPNAKEAYFNSQGFRTQETVGPKPPGQVRIIAIGGSTTEEVWSEDGLHWPLWLERQLAAMGAKDVKVYNAGMSAYSSAHDLIRLSLDVLDYEPDIVIMMHNINDLTVNYYAARDGREVDPHYLAAFGRKSFTGDVDDSDVIVSRLANALYARWSEWRQKPTPLPDTYSIDRGLQYFRRNLRSIDALVADRGSQLVLLTMPACDSEEVYRTVEFQGRRQFSAPLPSDFSRFNKEFEAYNEAVRQVAASRAIPMADMARLFGGNRELFSDFVHYNARGSQQFGEILASQLAPLVEKIRETAAKPR